MIRWLLFLVWSLRPPVQARAFRRAATWVDRNPTIDFYLRLLWVVYAGATPLERRFIDARHPEYVSLMKTGLEAQLRAVRS